MSRNACICHVHYDCRPGHLQSLRQLKDWVNLCASFFMSKAVYAVDCVTRMLQLSGEMGKAEHATLACELAF